MASREQLMAGDEMWHAVGPEAREDWAVHQASQDPLLLSVSWLFAKFPIIEQKIKSDIRGDLSNACVNLYGVPPERCGEVFAKAENTVRLEMIGEDV